jgi:hypothetical protein
MLRIESLQIQQSEKPKDSAGGWGFGFGGSGQVKNELEEAKKSLEIIQEELEAKIAENRKCA